MDKLNWPSEACKTCVDFLYQIKNFKEKVEETQENLLALLPQNDEDVPQKRKYTKRVKEEVQAIEDIEDVEALLAPNDEDVAVPQKRKYKKRVKEEVQAIEEIEEVEVLELSKETDNEIIEVAEEKMTKDEFVSTKSEDNESDMEVYEELDREDTPPPSPPSTRRITRNNTDDSGRQIVPQKRTYKKRKPIADDDDRDEDWDEGKEKRDRAKRKRQTRKLPKGTLSDYAGAADDDRIIRREDRLKAQARRSNLPEEMQEKKRNAYKTSLEKRFKQYAHLDPIVRDLGMMVCDICKVTAESFLDLCCHMERDHDILRYQAYGVCCNARFNVYTVYDHAQYHQNKDAFKCPDCGKQCHSGYSLKNHSHKHRPDEEMRHRCEICGKGFHAKDNFARHMKKHRVFKHNCPECKGSEYLKNKRDILTVIYKS